MSVCCSICGTTVGSFFQVSSAPTQPRPRLGCWPHWQQCCTAQHSALGQHCWAGCRLDGCNHCSPPACQASSIPALQHCRPPLGAPGTGLPRLSPAEWAEPACQASGLRQAACPTGQPRLGQPWAGTASRSPGLAWQAAVTKARRPEVAPPADTLTYGKYAHVPSALADAVDYILSRVVG